jgi:hypothetical protein
MKIRKYRKKKGKEEKGKALRRTEKNRRKTVVGTEKRKKEKGEKKKRTRNTER